MTNLTSRTARAKLPARGRPYTAKILPGLHLGYRRLADAAGTWTMAKSDGNGGQWTKRIGSADDLVDADGADVLDYEQAVDRARALSRGDADTSTTAPATIDAALTAYEADLTARGRNAYNGRQARFHLTAMLLSRSLAEVTTTQLRTWRDGLVRKGMNPATINRILKTVHAAFNLAAKLDERRIMPNAGAWKVGLEALPNATKARNAILTAEQVRAVVAAAYATSPEFGLYVQVHAETGSRSSQIAAITVGDLDVARARVMIPTSQKGKGEKRRTHTPVPVGPALLAKLAADRPKADALLLRADGIAWRPEVNDHRRAFEVAAEAAKLPAGTTIYALRHSWIVRALEAGIPIRIVASTADTSTAMIEQHYSAHIVDHSDDLVRRVLVDTSPADNVVPFAA